MLVDAENVRRSVWPNIGVRELAERSAEWGRQHDALVVVVYDGSGPAVEGVRTVDQLAEIRARSQVEIDAAADRAAEAPFPTLEETRSYVYAD